MVHLDEIVITENTHHQDSRPVLANCILNAAWVSEAVIQLIVESIRAER